jgi:hypothetical protein
MILGWDGVLASHGLGRTRILAMACSSISAARAVSPLAHT